MKMNKTPFVRHFIKRSRRLYFENTELFYSLSRFISLFSDPNRISFLGNYVPLKFRHKFSQDYPFGELIPAIFHQIGIPFVVGATTLLEEDFIPLKDVADIILQENLDFFLFVYNKRILPVNSFSLPDFDVKDAYKDLFQSLNIVSYHIRIARLLRANQLILLKTLSYKINENLIK